VFGAHMKFGVNAQLLWQPDYPRKLLKLLVQWLPKLLQCLRVLQRFKYCASMSG
jgi:hypothetical protein